MATTEIETQVLTIPYRLLPGGSDAIFVHRVMSWKQAHPTWNQSGAFQDLWVRFCSPAGSHSAVRSDRTVEADGFGFGKNKVPCLSCEDGYNKRLAQVASQLRYEHERVIAIGSGELSNFILANAWVEMQPMEIETDGVRRLLSEKEVSYYTAYVDHVECGRWHGTVRYRPADQFKAAF